MVDANDLEIGHIEKMKAHQLGVLHRAFSVFILNTDGDILLQKRASSKYHSGGLWSNTCCSHPRPYENTEDAAHRRLMEEMGMEIELTPAFSFRYKSFLDNGLIEHELDHVFIGVSNELPIPNPEEVEDYSYVSPSLLSLAMEKNPEDYTEWLKICFKEFFIYINQNRSDKKVGSKEYLTNQTI